MSNITLLNLKGSYLLVPIVIILTVVFTFIDSKITNNKVTNQTYMKLAILAGVIGIICVYINTLKGHIQEEVLTGAAPF